MTTDQFIDETLAELMERDRRAHPDLTEAELAEPIEEQPVVQAYLVWLVTPSLPPDDDADPLEHEFVRLRQDIRLRRERWLDDGGRDVVEHT